MEIMVKGITFLHAAGTLAEYERLQSFFAVLGLEPGKGWSEAESQGAAFLAPMGNLELVQGAMPFDADAVIEVTQLDAVYEAVKAWFSTQNEDGARLSSSTVSEITETHWKSRIFHAEPVPGHSFAFWEWSEPLKGKPVAVEGDLSAAGMRFAIVVARWNAVITDRLLEGAIDGLVRSGAKRADIEIVRVPGAWEVPAAARIIAELGKVDALITLGCLLRGETAHYEAIYNEVSRGIGQSQQETGIPHAFGVLTCETLEQALNRAGIKAGNKGFEAAVAAIEMVSLKRKLVAEAKS